MRPRPFILFTFDAPDCGGGGPDGGMNDCEGFYDTVEEAKAAAEAGDREVAEVWCRETMVLVAHGDRPCSLYSVKKPLRWSE